MPGGKMFGTCWWCVKKTELHLLHRLDSFETLGGYKPYIAQTWRVQSKRICTDCGLLFAQMRVYREVELLHLGKAAA